MNNSDEMNFLLSILSGEDYKAPVGDDYDPFSDESIEPENLPFILRIED
jgi:hypothetical protein